MATELVRTGIPVVDEVPWGTHFSLFCETLEDILSTAAAYFKAGLENNELCLWLFLSPVSKQDAIAALRQMIPDFESHLAKHSIEFLPIDEWYVQGDVFDKDKATERWKEKADDALTRGFAGLRGLGNADWLKAEYPESLAQFEKEFETWIARQRMIVLCTYPLESMSAIQMFDVAAAHRFITARRRGVWQVLETPELVHAKAEIRRLNEELEERVDQRTQELAAANADLSREIAERKRTEQELRRSESNFRTLADKSLQGIQIYQGNKIVYANPAMAAIMGYAIEEQMTMSLEELRATVHPDDRGLAEERTRKRLAGEELAPSVELRVVRKDGSTRWIQSFNNAIEYNGQRAILSTSIDITERKRAEETLKENESKLRQAQQLANIGYWEHDLIADRATGSEETSRIFGLPPDGALSRAEIQGMIHPHDREYERQAFSQALQGGRFFDVEYRLVRPDGSTRFVHVRDEIEYNESGQPIRMSGAVQDVTDRKRAEEAIRKSEQVLREAEILGHTGSWEQDLVTGEIFNTEENLHLFFGDDYGKGEHLEDYTQVVHPDDREFVVRRREQLLVERGPGDIEYRVVWPDGSVHVIFGRATVVRDESGKPVRIYGTNVDVTGRRQAEDALRRSEDHLRLVIDTIPVMAWSVRPDGVVDYLNQRWMDYTGISLEEYVKDPTRPIHPEDNPRVQEKWLVAVSAGKPYEVEMRLQGANGEYRWFLVRTAPLRDELGKIVKWYGVSADIDDRKRAEEEMNRQAGRAETLARIAARLNKQLDLDAVIEAVCQEAVDTLMVSQATMSLYDKERDQLVYAGGINIPPAYVASMEPISRARFEDFLREMGPIMVVPDIQSMPDVPNAQFSFDLDVRTVVTVAMLRGQELIGVLALGVNGHVREFDKDELTLAKAISDQAAQAIANALLLKTANEQREQLRALSAKLVEAQETERRTIARELHDEIGQVLNAVNANLHAIQLSTDQAKRTERLEESLALIDTALKEVRDLSLDLRPSMLDDFGLVPALEWYLEQEAQRSGFAAEIIAEPREMHFSPGLETTVFRVAQIALTNVARHARARHVRVELRRRGPELELVVRDDGVGFQVRATLERARRGATLGLASMQERVRLAGGQVEIESAPGQGTAIRARFPVNENEP